MSPVLLLKNYFKRPSHRIAACIIAIFLIGLIFVLSIKTSNSVHTQSYPMNHSWLYSLNQKNIVPLSLPTRVEKPFKKGDVVDLYTILPNTTLASPYLHIRIFLQQVKVTLDDEVLYDYTGDLNTNGIYYAGSGFIAIPIPEDYAFKQLHIQYIYNFDNVTDYIYPISLESSTLYGNIIAIQLDIFYINFVLFLGAVGCILVGIWQIIHHHQGRQFF